MGCSLGNKSKVRVDESAEHPEDEKRVAKRAERDIIMIMEYTEELDSYRL